MSDICLARIWNKGQGGRCQSKTSMGMFCGKHGKPSTRCVECKEVSCPWFGKRHGFVWEHLGRYDEPPPKFMRNQECYLKTETNNQIESDKSSDKTNSKIGSKTVSKRDIKPKKEKLSDIANIIRIKDKEGMYWLYDTKTNRCYSTDDIKLKKLKGMYNISNNSVKSTSCLID